jgi:hypothetical protein
VSQGDQRQLSTAYGTNDIFSFPYRENQQRETEKERIRVVTPPKERTYHLEGEEKVNYLWRMATNRGELSTNNH